MFPSLVNCSKLRFFLDCQRFRQDNDKTEIEPLKFFHHTSFIPCRWFKHSERNLDGVPSPLSWRLWKAVVKDRIQSTSFKDHSQSTGALDVKLFRSTMFLIVFGYAMQCRSHQESVISASTPQNCHKWKNYQHGSGVICSGGSWNGFVVMSCWPCMPQVHSWRCQP